MKKLYFLLIFLTCAGYSKAQINISSNDMPSAGDSARRTVAPFSLTLNYQATGVNHTWDFRSLKYQSQQVDEFYSVSSTNFLYALFFSNLPFNPNRANVATNGQAFPANPLITIEDPYNFYYRSSSAYEQVGLGASIQGIPIPVSFSQKDKIYEFPLNQGDIDTSVSSWNVSLPGILYYGFNQTRINHTDGWGTLLLPSGSYNVIRVVSELAASDTFNLDTLGIGMNIDRPLTREYKWLANNEVVPVLQITTTEIFGFEIISQVLFRDDILDVNPLNAPLALCAGSTYDLPYVEQGTFNGPALFSQGNRFTAELSDANGDFSNSVDIGNLVSTQSDTISITIPANTPAGTGYRIRIRSSNPAYTGNDNGVDIRIDNGIPAASVLSGINLSFCPGDSALLSGTPVNDATYSWQVDGSVLPGENGLSLTASAEGDYVLITSNACGDALSNIVSVDLLPATLPAVLSATAFTACPGDSITISSIADPLLSYQWYLDGHIITGEISNEILVSLGGDYTLETTGPCGTALSAPVNITINNLPAGIISASALAVCAGDSILLGGPSDTSYLYQWYADTTLIPGANSDELMVYQSGNYILELTNSCGSVFTSPLSVTVNPVLAQPVVNVNSTNDTLSTVQGFTYQWYLNGNLISNATDYFIVPASGGQYSVVITDPLGCMASSDPFAFSGTGIKTISFKNEINIFPNPASEFVYVNILNGKDITVNITDITGRMMFQATSENESILNIDVRNYSSGMYNLTIISGNEKLTSKLMVR